MSALTANQGAELQGTMIMDYIEANIGTIDRNGDGVIGYVLDHRRYRPQRFHRPYPRGVRKALGTICREGRRH